MGGEAAKHRPSLASVRLLEAKHRGPALTMPGVDTTVTKHPQNLRSRFRLSWDVFLPASSQPRYNPFPRERSADTVAILDGFPHRFVMLI